MGFSTPVFSSFQFLYRKGQSCSNFILQNKRPHHKATAFCRYLINSVWISLLAKTILISEQSFTIAIFSCLDQVYRNQREDLSSFKCLHMRIKYFWTGKSQNSFVLVYFFLLLLGQSNLISPRKAVLTGKGALFCNAFLGPFY